MNIITKRKTTASKLSLAVGQALTLDLDYHLKNNDRMLSDKILNNALDLYFYHNDNDVNLAKIIIDSRFDSPLCSYNENDKIDLVLFDFNKMIEASLYERKPVIIKPIIKLAQYVGYDFVKFEKLTAKFFQKHSK